MEVSKMFLSKDFKKKLNQPIGAKKRGELLWNRLVELDKSGDLQKANTRAAVARMVGYTDYTKGYRWVRGMVAKNALVETVRGFENGVAQYEYHLGTPLSYRSGRKPEFAKTGDTTRPVTNRPIVKEEKVAKPITLTITVGNKSFKVENLTIDHLKDILKGVI